MEWAIKYNQHDSGQHAHTHSHPLYIYVVSLHAVFFSDFADTANEKKVINSTDDLLMVYLTVMFYFSNWQLSREWTTVAFLVIHTPHGCFSFHFHSRAFFNSFHFVYLSKNYDPVQLIYSCKFICIIDCCLYVLVNESVVYVTVCFGCMCSLLSADHYQISLQL